MVPFLCPACGQTVFFENAFCGACGAALGYSPGHGRMVAVPDDDSVVRRCANQARHGFCNWVIDEGDAQELCVSCRLTRVLPDLSVPGNMEAWQKIEQAKKRLVVNLATLGLTPEPKRDENDAEGLSFEFLANVPGEAAILTGHADGVITLNIVEADDARREAIRVAMGEPMRTLLGHLRHEVSHYLQYRWLESDPDAMARCREVFGDEREDYAAALARHHSEGAPEDWPERFISAYASAHPWEDWAETCAHVLLVIDAVQTAAAWGVRLDGPVASAGPADTGVAERVDRLVLEQWLPVAQFLNAMNRSLGHADAYPFLMPDEVLKKMKVVQELLESRAEC